VLAAGALVAAGSIRLVLVPVVAGGLACGLAYNLGLARTVWSLAPWWGAFVLLPLASFLAAGRSVAWAGVLVGLAGLLALSLHLANALPDLQGDRVAGRMSLPVALGPRRSLVLSLGALAATAVVAMDVAAPLGQRVWVVVAGAAVALVAVLAGAFSGSRWLFPVLAPGGAVLAVCWLAALPGR
jgi:4-hydroxybenzoate polyprenyltransferase